MEQTLNLVRRQLNKTPASDSPRGIPWTVQKAVTKVIPAFQVIEAGASSVGSSDSEARSQVRICTLAPSKIGTDRLRWPIQIVN